MAAEQMETSQCKSSPALAPYWPNCEILAYQGVAVPSELLACTLLFLVVSMGIVVPGLHPFLGCLISSPRKSLVSNVYNCISP